MSWRKVKLGELVDNFSVRAKDVGGADGLEFFGVSNEIGITTTKYAAEEKAEDYKIIEKGCFAYNPYRVNVGSIGLMTNDTKGLISPAYVVFKPKPKSIQPELLLKFLKSSEGLRQIKLYARGTVRQALRFEDLCNIELSLPDYDTQNELLQKLNVTQNCAEQVLAEQSHQLELIKKLRQQILKDAMQGKLVPQNPKDEPASKLLEKIKNIQKKLIKEKKLKSGKSTGQSFSLVEDENIPPTWTWCKADEIFFITKLAGFEYSEHIKLQESGEIPVIRAQNVKPLAIDKSNLLYIDRETSMNLERCALTKKCLLVTFIGAGIGDVATFNEKERWHLAPNVAKMEPFEGCEQLLNVSYINYYLLSALGQREIFKHVKATAQPCLSMGTIRDIDIPLPPINEQDRIVEKVNDLFLLCDELEASVKANSELTTLLYQTALKEALHPKTIDVKQEDLAIAAEPKAEYKKGKVIELPRLQEKEESHFVKRKVLATYIINQSLDDQQFGDVKFEKLLHLSDYFAIKRNLGQNYYQKVAGPLDNSFTIPFFEQIEKSKWFNRNKIGRQFQFSKAVNHSKSLNTYSYFSDEELAKVQKLIDYFKKSDYEKPEIISTLYAVWNNRIIKQQPITDALIKQDFLEWDENKAKYKDRLDGALAWMRKEWVVPDGWGKVIEKPKTKKKK